MLKNVTQLDKKPSVTCSDGEESDKGSSLLILLTGKQIELSENEADEFAAKAKRKSLIKILRSGLAALICLFAIIVFVAGTVLDSSSMGIPVIVVVIVCLYAILMLFGNFIIFVQAIKSLKALRERDFLFMNLPFNGFYRRGRFRYARYYIKAGELFIESSGFAKNIEKTEITVLLAKGEKPDQYYFWSEA